MKIGAMLTFLVCARLVCAQDAKPEIDPDFIYFITLKGKGLQVAKVERIKPTPDMMFYDITFKGNDGQLSGKRIPVDNVKSIKPVPRTKPPPEPTPDTKTILDLTTNLDPYLDKKVKVNEAVLTLSNYYNYGYRDCRNTHVAFRIRDNTGSGYVYVSREWEGAEQLRQRAMRDGQVVGNFTLFIEPFFYRSKCPDLMAVLAGYSIPKN